MEIKALGELQIVEGLLSKREMLAAMAMQGYLSSGRKMTVHKGIEITIEEASVMAADALLNELNKENK